MEDGSYPISLTSYAMQPVCENAKLSCFPVWGVRKQQSEEAAEWIWTL